MASASEDEPISFGAPAAEADGSGADEGPRRAHADKLRRRRALDVPSESVALRAQSESSSFMSAGPVGKDGRTIRIHASACPAVAKLRRRSSSAARCVAAWPVELSRHHCTATGPGAAAARAMKRSSDCSDALPPKPQRAWRALRAWPAHSRRIGVGGRCGARRPPWAAAPARSQGRVEVQGDRGRQAASAQSGAAGADA